MERGNRLPSAARRLERLLCACLLLAIGTVAVPAPAAAAPQTRKQQWYLDTLRIPQAHRITTGQGVIVGLVDTGVDATHPALRGQILPGHGVGNDAPADGRTDPDRKKAHGTAMAGLIVGNGKAPGGYLGIAPGAKIYPAALGSDLTDGAMQFAVRWAVDNGAKVVNISAGGEEMSWEHYSAVKYALDHDVVVVSSAGNTLDGRVKVQAPASVTGAVAVGGTSRRGEFFTGSVQGPEMVIAAPQQDIMLANPLREDGYGMLADGGTSSAAAIVSGVVALIRARYPDLDANGVINRLIRTADDRGAPGRDPQYGFGLIDPVAALTADVSPVTANPLGVPKDPWKSTSTGSNVRYDRLAIVVGVLVAVLLGIVLLVVLLTRSRRRRPVPGAAGPPPGWAPPHQPAVGGHPPAGQSTPPGWAPTPPGWAPTPPGWAPTPPGPPAPGQVPPAPEGHLPGRPAR
ncbi:S8 family serine peptidase [Micromonospora sp. NPDC023888]|uniref:S8 family serine peptidase n=1 Tax=Micromonospora sp. NPDC023888 TaxID=3155607 RepID=UPI003409BA37